MIPDRIKELFSAPVDADVRLRGAGVFLTKVFTELESRLLTLEGRQLQKGDKGEKGDRGEQGLPGNAGRDGKSLPGSRGPRGDQGDIGPVGPAGADGASIVDAEIDFDGHLRLRTSDEKWLDAGPIGQNGQSAHSIHVAGNAWQITVSNIPPASPTIGQLWYDTN